MSKKLYLYPVWIRLWHALNAMLFLVLIFTGISMQYADTAGNFSLIRFEQAVKFHNVAAVILVLNYGFFVLKNALTYNGKYYKIRREGFFRDLTLQFRYYAYGMFRGEKHPFEVNEENKFNPLQKISYVVVIYLFLPFVIISGLALLFPEIIVRQVFGISGVLFTDLVHVIAGYFLSIFMIIHIYTCTLGKKPGTLFRSMINGYHESHD
jgi:thiosulfate reductase cytochrome b subunit